MRRACRVTAKFATASKQRMIRALVVEYRSAVNFFIRSLWNERGGLNKETLARLQNTHLSERFKSQALKQALEIVVATKKSAKATKKFVRRPVFRGSLVLDAKFVNVEEGHGSFDLVIRLSTLKKGRRIVVPTRKTAVVNKWLAVPGAKLIQGAEIRDDGYVILWIEAPSCVTGYKAGKTVGVDIGKNKMVVDSDGRQYGEQFSPVLLKIRRRKPGSMGRRRAFAERDNYINRTLNSLPWNSWGVLGVEDLHNLKKGKKKNRSKQFRKAIAPWVYRRVLERIGHKAQENRVRLIEVPPAYTSQTCPACGRCAKENRKGERFACVGCGHTADADFVGARNVLAKTLVTLGSVESPRLKKAV